MKKSLWKNNFKVIIKTRRRFMSILIMAFLGVGFFSGLVATAPDMEDSFDRYVSSSNLFDVDIVSAMGLTDRDVDMINDIDSIEGAYGVKSLDTLATISDNESVCKVIGYNENVNRPVLVDGRMPVNSSECLLDSNYSILGDISDYLGKEIFLSDNGFTKNKLTIVGIVQSPLYISSERGNSSIGSGKVDFYVYADSEVMGLGYYSNVYAEVKESRDVVADSDEYFDIVNSAIDDVEEIGKVNGWYVRSRKDNLGCTNIVDAIKTITNIAKIFPVIFYLVAVLISLTSMTRMIEEERTEIGTLKALGYTNLQIVSKYILYALLACVVGGFLGMTVGFYLIPNIVWKIYSAIYTIPEFYSSYRLDIGLKGLLLAFLCIGGATIVVAVKELRNMPSILMRPKAPKNGKKIFLERIPFVWKGLNFSRKVTARNIFRYKKRAIMTVVGIAGCTGLMLTGFGLKDSVLDIPESQYGKIFKYEMSVSLSSDNFLRELRSRLGSNEDVESYSEICATSVKLKGGNANYDTTVFIPDVMEDFEKVCDLRDVNSKEKISLTDSGVVVSDKVAEFLDIEPGDKVTLIDSDNLEYVFSVDAICENYVSNYLYMSKDFYELNMRDYRTNMVLVNTKQMTDVSQKELSESILDVNGVASVSMIEDVLKAIDDMLDSLDYVVVILIVASALLAFVVLYNLANINIGERQREIATLKVLGFYDKEVDSYINKENVIFTVIGVLLGLVFGYFLTDMIVASVEIDKLRFIRRILPWSYVYSAFITVAFSLVVNYIIHFVLKKIDMIESLKSVE